MARFSNGDDSMRKILILAGLLMGAALFTGTPAKANLGCECIKLGSAPMCTSGVTACTIKGGGVCVLPCSYQETKMHRKHVRHMRKKKK
jgi:hypothetical protein